MAKLLFYALKSIMCRIIYSTNSLSLSLYLLQLEPLFIVCQNKGAMQMLYKVEQREFHINKSI